MELHPITLYELNSRIKRSVGQSFPTSLWITAEIAELTLNRSGHCYLQLADKRADSDEVLATARATIWASTFRALRSYFESITGRTFGKGMKVLINVEVVFHEIYGFSLNIKDIDPTYTVGDLERRKQEILQRLKKEGMIDMNRRLEFPLLPKNIAVISSPTAAGLGDFLNQLENNTAGYRFNVKLFPAIMQGEKTTESIIAALDKIYEYADLFDVVVLIRGGGSQIDLGSFDSYELALNLAQFPLPIIAGIGHERDETIADMVAYLKVKTPTAAAVFLIECFQKQEVNLDDLQKNFILGVRDLLHELSLHQVRIMTDFKHLIAVMQANSKSRLSLLSQRTVHASAFYVKNHLETLDRLKIRMENRMLLYVERNRNQLDALVHVMAQEIRKYLADNKRKLEIALTTAKYVDPQQVLKRGYSITRLNGKALKTGIALKSGDRIETELAEGHIWSVYTKEK